MIFKEYTMEDVLDALIDYRGKTPKKSENGIPTLSAKSVRNGYIDYESCYFISNDEYTKFMVRGFPQKGDILLTTEAPLGNVAKLNRDDVAIAQRLITLRGKKAVIDNDYLMYWLQSPQGQKKLTARATGTTVTGIKQAEFRKITISLPEYADQLRIAFFLGCIDKRIDNNKAINDNLLEQARTFFNHYFSDKPTNGTLSTIICEYPKSKIKVGEAKGKSGPYPFFTSGTSILDYPEFLVDGRCVLLNTGGAADVKYHIGKLSYSTDTWCIYGKDDYTDYLFLLLDSIVSEIDSAYFEGSTLRHLQKPKLKAREIYIPPVDELLAFNNIVSPMFNLIVRNKGQNRILANLRDSLLPKLMSGELDIYGIDL